MGNLRYDDKRDLNERSIIRALEQAFCSVCKIKGETGMPDLLVGRNGSNYLLEVKGERGRVSGEQVEWHQAWRGGVTVVRTPEEALAAVGVGGHG